MARFNNPQPRQTPTGPIRTVQAINNLGQNLPREAPTTITHEGGAGWLRDARSELFTLAVLNMHNADSFYESGKSKDDRFVKLIRKLAVEDFTWTFNMLRWLRGPEGNLRTASLVGAAEAVKARLDAKMRGATGSNVPNPVDAGEMADVATNRRLIDAVLQRADEPGEFLSYWTTNYGKNLPMPVKRGVADAVHRLYTERGFLRYDSDSRGFRFGDVIDLVHPKTDITWQNHLWNHAINVRHGRGSEAPALLYATHSRATINSMSARERHELARLAIRDGLDHSVYKRAMAGQWEWLLSSLGDTTGTENPVSKLDQWKLVLPQLGIFALARNLRNLEQAGIGNDQTFVQLINERLSDPEEIAKSRMMPFRWWQSYQAANSHLFSQGLENAVNLSLRNIPELPGKSLVLVDTSASMTNGLFAKNSTMTPVQAAALFGVALTVRNPGNVHLIGFASGEFQHTVMGGSSVLKETERFTNRVGEVGHGTDIHGAIHRTFRKGHHDRVFIISDMQTIGGYYGSNVDQLVPRTVPVYGFNLGGYGASAMPLGSGNRYELGGLTDATFKMVKYLERGENASWPWDLTD